MDPLNYFGISRRIAAMSFQGKDFTPEMKPLVINLKLYFDEERRHYQEVSTRNPTLRTAQGLGIGEVTVKRIAQFIAVCSRPKKATSMAGER